MPRRISSLLLLVTRPEPAAGETAAALRGAGYDVLVSPALIAIPLPRRDVPMEPDTRLIVTSPQAASFLNDWSDLHSHTTLAVGERTAQILRAAGFTAVESAGGDAAAILAHFKGLPPQSLCLLGAPSTGHALASALQAQGHGVTRHAVYRVTDAADLTPAAAAALAQRRVTHSLFYSARTARSFLVLAGAFDVSDATALCLSPAVAAAVAGAGYGQVLTAPRPTAEALQGLLPALDLRL